MQATAHEGSPTPTDASARPPSRDPPDPPIPPRPQPPPTSARKQSGCLRHCCHQIGHLRLNKIRPFHLTTVPTALAKDGYSGRSVNLYLITIRDVDLDRARSLNPARQAYSHSASVGSRAF